MSPKQYKSTCSYCGVGCGVTVSLDRRGKLSLKGDKDSPVNAGMLCSKGRHLHSVVMDQSDRLLHPKVRYSRAHPLQSVSWDIALDRVSQVFKAIIKEHGPNSVGLYVSGQMLTEEYYVANKLMKGFIGSNNIDTNSRLCMSSAVVGYKKAFGDDLVPTAYEDIDVSDCFFIAGANPAWCHPIVYRRMEARKTANPDTKIIVVDPRETDTCALADLHLQINPGTDVVLYNAIARHIVEKDLHDIDFIRDHVNGFHATYETIFATSLEDAAQTCGVPVEDICTAGQWLGESKSFLSFWAMGLNQSSSGVDKNLALLNLSLITGKIGKPGSGPFSLTGQSNAMGGREVGGLSNLLAAHRDLADPTQRNLVARYWGVPRIQEKPGLTATEMIDALNGGTLKAIWIICTNPAVSLPNAFATERALRKARFVVVQDISDRSDTLAYADAVLPAAGWLEKQGTMTNSERRVTYLPKVMDAPGEALPDYEILCRFASKMGWEEAFSYESESDVFDEHVGLTKDTPIDMSGMSYDRLKQESLQWPCSDTTHSGTTRLFEDAAFATRDGKAQLHAVAPTMRSEPTSEPYPLVLTTGRIRDQWHTMTRTGKVSRLRQHIDSPFLEIHPADAGRLELEDGATAQIENDRGSVEARIKITLRIKQGCVFLPMHWGKQLGHNRGRANNLTSDRVDPDSKEPDFKYAAVRVRPITIPIRKIVVAGSGAASLEFIQTYRTQNKTDSIEVFGNENQPFYNRILLPDYVKGKRSWVELCSSGDDLLESLDVTYHPGPGVARIHRESKKVVTNAGDSADYDVLVLATGSSAAVPPGTPTDKDNVFTLRNRADAERLRNCVQPGSEVAVIGGGLLGIELSDALSDLGAQCTLIHRSATLMRGVIDETASSLLQGVLEDRGIKVLMSDGVVRYYGDDTVTGLQTRSGRRLNCDVVCVATGISSNADLAVDSGLNVRRGVVVDAALQTSDPSIYAIGEVAEIDTTIYGTTPAVRAQAQVAVMQILGDRLKTYSGTIPMNILKIRDFSLSAVGNLIAQDGDTEEVTLLDEAASYYKKCCIRGGKLVGAVLVGDNSELAEFSRLIDNETELDDIRWTLLRGNRKTSDPPKGRIVCSCYNVGLGNIEDAINAGCDDLGSIGAKTCAGTGCKSCLFELSSIIREKQFSSPQLATP